MNSYEDTYRQLRIALTAIAIIIPMAIIGFMIIEDLSLLDATWLTIITIATVGYGDIVAHEPVGRLFTIILVITGLGIFAYAAQAAFAVFVSPAIRDARQKRRAERKIATLRNHYVICGAGKLVDTTVEYLLRRAEVRREQQDDALHSWIEQRLAVVLGKQPKGPRAFIRRSLQKTLFRIMRTIDRGETILDVVVAVTRDKAYADHLRRGGLLVIEDDPTDDRALRRAGIKHAQAMMVLLESDTEALLTVLTARSRNQSIYITAATMDDAMGQKMIRVGANNVTAPFEAAGQFLNNATLRPAVNDFFSSILFDQRTSSQVAQIQLNDQSKWVNQRLGQLDLRHRFDTGVIGLRTADGDFIYAPSEDYILNEGEVILAMIPPVHIPDVMLEATQDAEIGSTTLLTNWQYLPSQTSYRTGSKTYTLDEAEEAVQAMSQHFIICGSGQVMQRATSKLDPDRPFVILSNDDKLVEELLGRGFRVIKGDATHEEVLLKAGADRALAIMVTVEEDADAVLTILNSRTLSKKLLITATASSDDMIPKLRRAGADRVISPFRIAAQFVLQATTRPAVSDFMQHVLFNYQTGLETTELYMQDNSPWIGKTIGELLLERLFRAAVIGVRRANGRFIYAPPDSHEIGEHEVLIITTPMVNSDELRLIAHGGESKRPETLRREDEVRASQWL